MLINGQTPFDFLQQRGLLYQTTNLEQVKEMLNGKQITFYLGIDPTAEALHIGHLCSLRTFHYLQQAGHRGILVVGGATALIGDPSGRQDMRTMLTKEKCEQNMANIKMFAEKFIDTTGENAAIITNNASWTNNLSYLDFLREVGTYFNVNTMLSAEAYKNRLTNGGLTFLEMGYMPIQANDFLHLNQAENCVMQVGGSDQWGNMVAGTELVRRKLGKHVNCMTTPLLLNSKGEKMGKTTGGALWVSSDKTSVYDFYQYFVNIDDNDVKTLLYWFSDFDCDYINRVVGEDIIAAKKLMAYTITKLVHGEECANVAKQTAEEVFAGNGQSQNMPSFEIQKAELEKTDVCGLLVQCKICSSKSEARRLIEQGGVAINGEKVEDIAIKLDFVEDFVVKKGKKTFMKIKLV